jgi:hypothetical protein
LDSLQLAQGGVRNGPTKAKKTMPKYTKRTPEELERERRAWEHVWVYHHDRVKARPNMGECGMCGRNADYVVRFPNGTRTEYCLLCCWEEVVFYLGGFVSRTKEGTSYLDEHKPTFGYVEHLEQVR